MKKEYPHDETERAKLFAEKVKEKLARLFTPEYLERLARQSCFIQRASSKLTGQDFLP